MKTFMSELWAGNCGFEAADDWAERWHDSPHDGRSMDEFMGFTEEEGSLWATDPTEFERVMLERIAKRDNGIVI